MINEGTNYIRSPLLAADPEKYELEELAAGIEEEMSSIIKGDYTADFTDENLASYSFSDSISSQNPDWWRPTAADTRLQVDDSTVEEWYHRGISQLKGSTDYRLSEDEDIDNMTGEAPPLRVIVGDREQKTEKVTLEGEDLRSLVDTERASQILEEYAPGRDYDHSSSPSIEVMQSGNKVDITPDLSSGFFQSEIRFGANSHTGEVWMPYADREKAVLVSTPSQFDPDASASVVPVSEKSFTGDPLTDAVSESLSYMLPFESIPQREVSSEAIEYRSNDPLSEDPFSQQILEDAWKSLKELDSEYQKRVMEKMDDLSFRPQTSPLSTRENGNIIQIGSEEVYIRYEADQQSETVQLKEILDRKEAFGNSGRTGRT